jgi:hypothetical protein
MGTFLWDGIRLAQAGVPNKTDFPYYPDDPKACIQLPSETIRRSAADYRLAWKATVDTNDITQIKSFLAGGYAVLIAFRVDTDFYAVVGDSVYDNRGSHYVAGHALAVVGYDDAKSAFRVINSWGESWGSRGLGWISYETFKVRATEAYVTEEYVANLSLLGSVGGPANTPSVPPVFAFRRNVEFTGNVIVSTRRIVFDSGVTVRVRNGATLELRADEIIVEGAATIDGTGEPGAIGESPRPESLQAWSSHEDSDYGSARVAIETNSSHPDRGKPGGSGQPGGAGASVILSQKPVGGALQIIVEGGPGGPPGHGSTGRLIKNGRNNYCDGCMYQNVGPDGRYGPKGQAGSISMPH